jgi:hypothetical protein
VTGYPTSTLPLAIEEGDEIIPVDKTCDQIRANIRAFIASGEMKVTEFQRHLNVNSNSYGRFMKLKGPISGHNNQTFDAAFRFFREREQEGKKISRPPKAKKAKVDDTLDSIKDIKLPGEEEGDVRCWESCDEIRRKINTRIRDGETQASLCKAFAAMCGEADKKIQGAQLSRFLRDKGPTKGAQSSVYYGAYIYFEKLRIKDGKKKSKHREEMEKAWAFNGGIDRKASVRSYIMHSSERMSQDSLGVMHFSKRGNKAR